MKLNRTSFIFAVPLTLAATSLCFAQVAGQDQAAAKSQTTTGQPATNKGTTTSTQGGTTVKGLVPQKTKPKGIKVKTAGLPKPPPPPPPAWTQFKLNPKTTIFLDFTDSNPDSVFSVFSRTSGITIVKDPSFKLPLTVTSAKAVSLKDAFEILNTVLNLDGFELQKQGNLLIVGKKVATPPPAPPPGPPPAPPQPEAKAILHVYALKNANASQVARVINEVFSQQQLENIVQGLANGGGFNPMPMQGRPAGPKPEPVVRASSEDYSNSVVVNAPKEYQDQVADLVKQLDQSTELPLVTKIFKLKYVDVDEVTDAIQQVLTSNAPLGKGGKKQDQQNQNFFYYNPFGNQSNQNSGQSATEIRATNSVIVSATKENMDSVEELIKEMDQQTDYVGTTFVIHLENAKASDVATLLMQAFTKPKNSDQNDNPFVFFYPDSYNTNKKKDITTDVTEDGEHVNVRDLTGKVNIMPDPNTNSLIVVTLPSNMKLIRKVVDQIDKVSEQVMIETVIVEVNLDKITKLGVEWNFQQNSVFNTTQNTAAGSQSFGIQGQTPAAQGFTYTLTGANYKAFLNALQTDTKYKVLSTPRIFTSNNVKAEINVSQKVPYITSQQATLTTQLISNYDFKDVGVVLTVTPRITENGQVTMDVVQSADDLQGYTTFNAPIINHREASTTVSIVDGQTVILGGIIRSTINNTENKIPLLGDLPLLGPLFRSTSKEHQQTELMVLLTPHIIKDNVAAQKLREMETKELSKESQDSLKQLIDSKP
jgi:general secretion pathway protein D